jgi:hypothetical protein
MVDEEALAQAYQAVQDAVVAVPASGRSTWTFGMATITHLTYRIFAKRLQSEPGEPEGALTQLGNREKAGQDPCSASRPPKDAIHRRDRSFKNTSAPVSTSIPTESLPAPNGRGGKIGHDA